MRTMMKKSGAVAALTAVLLVMAVLVTTGCQGPETESSQKAQGSVSLILGNNARTILPEETDFVLINLVFTADTDALVVGTDKTIQIEPAPSATAIVFPVTIPSIGLDLGEYTLTVTGYSDSGATPVAIASTLTSDAPSPFTPGPGGITVEPTSSVISDVGFKVATGDDIQLAVVLKPYAFGNGTGTFTYTIDISGIADIDIATITLSEYEGGGTPVAEDLPATPTLGTIDDVVSGMYWVDFNIVTENNGGIEYRDLVHIYQNMTSDLELTFTEMNLYRASSGGITYIPPSEGNFGVLGLTAITTGGNIVSGDGKTQSTAIKLSKTDNDAPTGVTISLTQAVRNGLANYTWYYNGNPIPIRENNTLTVSVNDPFFSDIGRRAITLTITTFVTGDTMVPPQAVPPITGTFSMVIWVETGA